MLNLIFDHPQASSPGSVYSSTGPSNSLTWGTTLSSSSVQSRESTLGGHGGTGSVGFPSVSSMHTSSESIDMSLGSAGGGGHGTHREDTLSALGRTGSVKTGMSERLEHTFPTNDQTLSPLIFYIHQFDFCRRFHINDTLMTVHLRRKKVGLCRSPLNCYLCKHFTNVYGVD